MSEPTVGSFSPGGVIVGADQRQFIPVPPATTQTFTSDDLARVREQEKNKLYPQLEALREEVERLKAERDAEVQREAQHRADAEAVALAAAEEARKKAESEMDTRALLEKQKQEWENRFAEMQKERERQDAMLQREQELRELIEYREAMKSSNADTIHPTLIDMVDGGSRAEIDASIARLQQKSAAILSDAQAALSQLQAGKRGTAPTGAPAGDLLDTYSEQQSLTPEQIRDMPMSEWRKQRGNVINQSQRERGLFS